MIPAMTVLANKYRQSSRCASEMKNVLRLTKLEEIEEMVETKDSSEWTL